MTGRNYFCFWLVMTLAAWSARNSAAQNTEPQFERISIEQGLSQNTVFCVIQDAKGFVWVGTQDGLNKYDGYSFTVYKHSRNDPESLSNNVVRAIYEDRAGVLWIGTNGGGLNRFDRVRATFTHYKHDPEDPSSLSNDNVVAICQDQAGMLWLGTLNGGLNRFDPTAGTFERFVNGPFEPIATSYNFITATFVDRSGRLWVGSNGGLSHFDRDREIFTNYQLNLNNAIENGISAIFEDLSGTLWVGGTGLSEFDRENGTFVTYRHDPNDSTSLSGGSVWSIYEDEMGALWVGTSDGLNKLRPPSEDQGDNRSKRSMRFVRYLHDSGEPTSLSDSYIQTVYEDQSGIVWIGTWSGGLNKFDRDKDKFVHYNHDPSQPQSISHANVRAIYGDRSGVLWVGTRGGGLNRLVRRNNSSGGGATFLNYKHDPTNLNSLSHNYVWSILEDRRGSFWIGTYGGGLNKFDRARERFTRYNRQPNNPTSLSHHNVTPIHEDKSGVLWVGTDGGGLNKLVEGPQGQPRFEHYQHDATDPNSLSHNDIWSIHEDRLGRLWVGTSGGGLNRLNADGKSFTHYKHDPNVRNSLSNNYVFSIYQDRQGRFWIGTWGGGLNRLVLSTGLAGLGGDESQETAQFKHYTASDGLANDVVYGIVEDRVGNIWLSTNQGLSRFNPETEEFKNYNTSDGIQSNEFNANAYHQSPAGELFFGGINGFNAFYPDRIQDNTYIPPIVITSVKRFDDVIRTDIVGMDKFELSHRDKYLSFEFVALDYTNPEKNQYAYMMQGFDNDWSPASKRRFASYTNLDAGDYVFRVKGSNNDGIWNHQGTSVKIRIHPPPWQTWWAYALYLTATIAILYGVRLYDLKRIRLKNQLRIEQMDAEKLKELDQMKSRFFANISHEFRTPLTLILGPIERVISKAPTKTMQQQLQVAFENGRRLLRLINQLLDLSKLEAGGMKLNATRQNVLPFLKGILFTFEAAAEEKQIKLAFESSYPELELFYDIGKLEQVFYNLVSNAIKFVPRNSGGTVTIEVVKSQVSSLERLPPNVECVQITVADTGAGIADDEQRHIFDRFYQVKHQQAAGVPASGSLTEQGTGIGLALAKEIVELHHGQIGVKSTPGQGTKFVVTLPLGKEHLDSSELAAEVSSGVAAHHSSKSPLVEAPADNITEERGASGPEPDRELASVLIVEDNAELRAFVRQHLQGTYQIDEAENGRAGFEIAATTLPELIISDVMMPEADGLELARKLKDDERTSHIPVVLLTARAAPGDKLQGLQSGVDDYLTKPFSSEELLSRVQNLIAQRRKLRKRFSREVLLKPSEIAITSADEAFLNRVKDVVEEHLGDEQFSVEGLGRRVGMSRGQLHRKLRALTDQSASQFILSMRLQRATDLIRQNAGTISEIAYMVGFNAPNYFAKCFRKQFGCSPSEYKIPETFSTDSVKN